MLDSSATISLNRMQLSVWRILEHAEFSSNQKIIETEHLITLKLKKVQAWDGALQKHGRNRESQTVQFKHLDSIRRLQLFEMSETRLWSSQPLSQSTEQEHCWVICKEQKLTSQLLTYPKQFPTCPSAAHAQSPSRDAHKAFQMKVLNFSSLFFSRKQTSYVNWESITLCEVLLTSRFQLNQNSYIKN